MAMLGSFLKAFGSGVRMGAGGGMRFGADSMRFTRPAVLRAGVGLGGQMGAGMRRYGIAARAYGTRARTWGQNQWAAMPQSRKAWTVGGAAAGLGGLGYMKYRRRQNSYYQPPRY